MKMTIKQVEAILAKYNHFADLNDVKKAKEDMAYYLNSFEHELGDAIANACEIEAVMNKTFEIKDPCLDEFLETLK